jgi:hypothetical protein
MTAHPSRRDFLNGTLLAAAGALLNSVSIAQILCSGPPGRAAGEGDYRNSNANKVMLGAIA